MITRILIFALGCSFGVVIPLISRKEKKSYCLSRMYDDIYENGLHEASMYMNLWEHGLAIQILSGPNQLTTFALTSEEGYKNIKVPNRLMDEGCYLNRNTKGRILKFESNLVQ